MENISKIANSLAQEGFHCSESILIAFERILPSKLEKQTICASTPFAGGIGRNHIDEICGALSGGLMVIGLLFGRAEAHTNDDYCQYLAGVFYNRFYEHFGSVNCKYLRDNWVRKSGQENCYDLIEQSSTILLDLLEKKI